MVFRHLIIAAAVTIGCSVFSQASLGQTVSSSGEEVSTSVSMVESTESANRSGIVEAARGSFEAEVDTEGRIGRSAEDVREMLQELRGADRRRRRTDMSVENLNERRRARRRQQGQRNPPPPVHVQFQPSFNFKSAPPLQVANGMQSRITSLLEKRAAGSVQVALNNRTATLTGTVKSDYQRRLLGTMARLEPSVSAVENLIAVEEQVAAPALTPAR